jgi:hypothetical protein
MTKSECVQHYKIKKADWKEYYGEDILAYIEDRFKKEIKYLEWRDVLIV